MIVFCILWFLAVLIVALLDDSSILAFGAFYIGALLLTIYATTGDGK